MKMDRLRTLFEKLGSAAVRSYVQSGNVVFECGEASPTELSEKLEARVREDFGLSIPVFVKSAKELRSVSKRNPFVKQKGIDQSGLYVTFLSEKPPKIFTTKLELLATNFEQFQLSNRELYLYCPNGYGKTKLSNTTIEKKLSVVATTRNWRTVNSLLQMAHS